MANCRAIVHVLIATWALIARCVSCEAAPFGTKTRVAPLSLARVLSLARERGGCAATGEARAQAMTQQRHTS